MFLHNLKPCEEISITLDDNNVRIFLNHSHMNLICLGCLIFNLVKLKPNRDSNYYQNQEESKRQTMSSD